MNILSSVVASFHYLAFAISMGGLFMRGVFIKKLFKSPQEPEILKSVFIADNFWGVGAFLLLASGLARAFAGLEKGSQFYLHNTLFLYKMGMVVLILVLEVKPMLQLIRWRNEVRKEVDIHNFSSLPQLEMINDVEITVLVMIPFFASMMARGIAY